MKNKNPFWMKLDWRGARPLTLRELIMKSKSYKAAIISSCNSS